MLSTYMQKKLASKQEETTRSLLKIEKGQTAKQYRTAPTYRADHPQCVTRFDCGSSSTPIDQIFFSRWQDARSMTRRMTVEMTSNTTPVDKCWLLPSLFSDVPRRKMYYLEGLALL